MSTTYEAMRLEPRFKEDESPIPAFRSSRTLTLTRFADRTPYGVAVQVTLCPDNLGNGGNAHFCLSKEQAIQLAYCLLKPYSGDEISPVEN